jgi:predicted Zn-dependent protease
LLLLAACAEPATRPPSYESAAVSAEAARQQELAKQGKIDFTPLTPEQAQAKLQRIAPGIVQHGTALCKDMRASACSFNVVLSRDASVNAAADGEKIIVNTGMVSFTTDDAELAMALAHEYAHNILTHPQSMGVNTAAGGIAGGLIDAFASSRGFETGDTFSKVGAQYGALKYSIEFEKEADYVGLYILARANYDLNAATNFWRRMSAHDPGGIYGGQTHPSNPERFVAMSQAIAEIGAKKSAGQPLVPEFKPQRRRFGF